MSIWFRKVEASSNQTYFSNEDERIILFKREIPVRILDKGKFTTSFWDINLNGEYDELMIIDLRPKEILLEINEGLITADGVRVSCKISSSAKIKSDREFLFRIANNVENEESFLKTSIRQAIKSTVASLNWTNLIIHDESKLETYKNKIYEILKRNDLCFSLLQILDITFLPIDIDLANRLEEKRKIKEQEELENLITQTAKRKKEIEIENEESEKIRKRQIEKIELAHKLELQQLELAKQMEIEKLKQANDLELEKLKLNQQLEHDKLKHANELDLKNLQFTQELGHDNLKNNQLLDFESLKLTKLFAIEKERFEMQANFLLKNPNLIQLINPELAKAMVIAEAQGNQKHTETIKTILMKTLEEDAEKAKLIGHIEQRTVELKNTRNENITFSEGRSSLLDDLIKPAHKKEKSSENEDENIE